MTELIVDNNPITITIDENQITLNITGIGPQGPPGPAGASTSINGLSGAVNLVAGSNIAITESGQNITIASSSAVSSVFGRTGTVTAQSGDYNTSQVTENTNLYFTAARVLATALLGFTVTTGTISASDTVLSSIEKLYGNQQAQVTGVSSVFGRTGSVSAQSGDYSSYYGRLAVANVWSAANSFTNGISASDGVNSYFNTHGSFPTTPYTTNVAANFTDGSNNGQFSIFSQGGNYWNIVNFASDGALLARQAFGNDGTTSYQVASNAVIICGGYGLGFGNTFVRVGDDPNNTGVLVGDGLGGLINVLSGTVCINNVGGGGQGNADQILSVFDNQGRIALQTNTQDGYGSYLQSLNNILDDGAAGNATIYSIYLNNGLFSQVDGNQFLQYQEFSGVVSQVSIGDLSGLYGLPIFNFGNIFSDSQNSFGLGQGNLNLGSASYGPGALYIYDGGGNLIINTDSSGDFTALGNISCVNGAVNITSFFGNIFFNIEAQDVGNGACLNLQGYAGRFWQIQGGSTTSGSTGLTIYGWGNGMNIYSGGIAFRAFDSGRVRIGTMTQSGGTPGSNASDDAVSGLQCVGGLSLYAQNITTDTTTGLQIGTASTQKLGLWGATPVARQTSHGTTTGFTASTGTAVLSGSTFTGNSGSTAYTIGDIVLALKTMGVLTV